MHDTIDPPETRAPRCAGDERALTGKRIIWRSTDPDLGIDQDVRDYRAASEVFTDGGRDFVRIVPELDWYAWTTDPDPGKTPACPRAVAWPADLVWVE